MNRKVKRMNDQYDENESARYMNSYMFIKGKHEPQYGYYAQQEFLKH